MKNAQSAKKNYSEVQKMSRTATNMKKLIEKKYYATAEDALAKLDVFYMAGRISDDEYTDLVMLVEEYYPEPVEEVVEEKTEETEVSETAE